MAYTYEDVRRDAEEYLEWARQKDREQFIKYVEWLRGNREYIKRSGQYEAHRRLER
jgi:hypothetical protein